MHGEIKRTREELKREVEIIENYVNSNAPKGNGILICLFSFFCRIPDIPRLIKWKIWRMGRERRGKSYAKN